MILSKRLKHASQHALILFPLLFTCHGGASAAPTPPAAATTFDVCQDDATGNWRYFGVVSVAGKSLSQDSLVSIDYAIQNQVANGYADVLHAQRLADDPAVIPETPAKVARYSIDAAPLVLGTLRNASRIAIADPLNLSAAPLSLEPRFDLIAPVCGCPKPTGCTRTQGYWKSKPGVTWTSPYSRTAMFFSSGLTWQQILETPPAGGDAYLILAHQYIAAVLNRAAGASAPSAVQTVISKATTFFSSGTTLDSCAGSACETQKSWAGILDTYNNGQYPGAPKHCPE